MMEIIAVIAFALGMIVWWFAILYELRVKAAINYRLDAFCKIPIEEFTRFPSLHQIVHDVRGYPMKKLMKGYKTSKPKPPNCSKVIKFDPNRGK